MVIYKTQNRCITISMDCLEAICARYYLWTILFPEHQMAPLSHGLGILVPRNDLDNQYVIWDIHVLY